MSALDQLRAIVDRGDYNPQIGRERFFGENCLLIQAAQEARETGTHHDLAEVVRQMLTQGRLFRQVYRGLGTKIEEQGEKLLQAVGKMVLADCTGRLSYAKEAAEQFNEAWKETEEAAASQPWPAQRLASGFLETIENGRLKDCQEALLGTPPPGFWIVWDFLSRQNQDQQPTLA